MRNSSDKSNDQNLATEDVWKRDIQRIREQFGKGMGIEEIADVLGLDPEYVEVLFWFGIV